MPSSDLCCAGKALIQRPDGAGEALLAALAVGVAGLVAAGVLFGTGVAAA